MARRQGGCVFYSGIIAFAFSYRVLACECAPPPPVCEAVGHSDLIFTGTVKRVSGRDGQFKTAEMTVDAAFKGPLNKTIELFDDGMCDGPDLQLGKQYLMYTSQFPGGGIPSRGCTRSRSVEQASEDLAFLTQYRAGRTGTYISGVVRLRPDGPNPPDLKARNLPEPVPLKDVRVTVEGNGALLSAATALGGGYSFPNLAAGEYTVRADFKGYSMRLPAEAVTLVANGCVEADISMEIDRRVQGTVRDASGSAVPGVMMEMILTQPDLERWEQPILLDLSDEMGHYVIHGIPPGEYYLGVSINSTPTKENPYPPNYYPNTSDVKSAARIRFDQDSSFQEFDFRVPHKLSVITVHGRVLGADGTLLRPADRPQVRIKEPGLEGQIETSPIVVDSEGRFEIELCEGVSYSAFALSGSMRAQKHSAPVAFTARENEPLVLTVDKTNEEVLELPK
jgi:hypothetical protein